MPFAQLEFSNDKSAFRCLRIVNDDDNCVGEFKECIQLGVPWSVEDGAHTQDALQAEVARFDQLQEQIAQRVQQAQSAKTEIQGMPMPAPIDHDKVAEEKASRDSTLKPLLDAQRLESEIAPRLQQFWVVTIMSFYKQAHLIVHGAHPDLASAEKHARAVIDDDSGTNEADVISARSWFVFSDFQKTDLARTTYVNDEQLNKTMQNAHWKSEMARAVMEKAKAEGHDLPPPDRQQAPGFVVDPQVTAQVTA